MSTSLSPFQPSKKTTSPPLEELQMGAYKIFVDRNAAKPTSLKEHLETLILRKTADCFSWCPSNRSAQENDSWAK